MSGKIRTREKCPKCARPFQIIEEEKIFCPTCQTTPSSFYIYLYYPDAELGRDHKITRDTDKNILDSYRRTKRLLEKIRSEIDSEKYRKGSFNLRNYLPKESNAFRGKILFQKWLNYIKSKKRALNYTRKLDQYTEDHFIPKLEDFDCTQIKTNDISNFRNYLFDEYRKKDGDPLSPKAVKNVLDQLKSFCKWLMREELITRMPIFDPVEVPETLPAIMPLEDRQKVLAAVKSPNLRNALSFYSHHPIRPSEVAALDVRHFDLHYGCVKVEFGLDYDRSLKTRKNKKEYVIPLSKHWDSSSIQGRFGKEIAFPNSEGGRYNAHTLNEAWKRYCEKVGVPYVNLYNAMKHTTMTEMARNGASKHQLQSIAGHSSGKSQDKYIALSVESIRHLVDNVTEIRKAEGE